MNEETNMSIHCENKVGISTIALAFKTSRCYTFVSMKISMLKCFYWLSYLALCFTSVWFVSGVVDNFLSKKTSFSQSEGYSFERPVITIILTGDNAGSLKLPNDLKIKYCPSYRSNWYSGKKWGKAECYWLENGNNNFSVMSKAEKVYLEINDYFAYYRIIPQTPLSEDQERGNAEIKVYLKKKVKSTYLVYFYVTSLENSLGHVFYKWNDGEEQKYQVDDNSRTNIKIQPQKFNYLKEVSKCHDESYYECIAAALHRIDHHTLCKKKCIPSFFGFGRNYTTPFCNNRKDDKCARDIAKKMIRGKGINFTQEFSNIACTKACSSLQYSGNFIISKPIVGNATEKYKSLHQFYYEFSNSDNKCPIFNEYLIYDTMGMIGSVGGTFGMFIGFSMTGVISSVLDYFRKYNEI